MTSRLAPLALAAALVLVGSAARATFYTSSLTGDPVAVSEATGQPGNDFKLVLLTMDPPGPNVYRVAVLADVGTSTSVLASLLPGVWGEPGLTATVVWDSSDVAFTASPGPVLTTDGETANYEWSDGPLAASTAGAVVSSPDATLAFVTDHFEWTAGGITLDAVPFDNVGIEGGFLEGSQYLSAVHFGEGGGGGSGPSTRAPLSMLGPGAGPRGLTR